MTVTLADKFKNSSCSKFIEAFYDKTYKTDQDCLLATFITDFNLQEISITV